MARTNALLLSVFCAVFIISLLDKLLRQCTQLVSRYRYMGRSIS